MTEEDSTPLLSCPFYARGSGPFTLIHRQHRYLAFENTAYTTISRKRSSEDDVTIHSDVTSIDDDVTDSNSESGEPQSELTKRLRIVQNKEKVKRLLSKSKFASAVIYLERLLALERDPAERFKAYLLLADTYCQLHNVVEALKAARSLKDLVTEIDMSSSRIGKMAESELYQKHLIKAFLYFVCEAKLFVKNSYKHRNSNEALKNIMESVEKIRFIVLNLKDHFTNICSQFIIPLMVDIYKEASGIKGKTKNDQVYFTTWILYYIASCHAEIREYAKARIVNRNAIEQMNRQMGDDAIKYKVYALCLHNLGFTYSQLTDYVGAVTAYQRALAACNANENWENSKVKEIFIVLTKHELKKAKYFSNRPKFLKLLKFPDYIYLRCSGVV